MSRSFGGTLLTTRSPMRISPAGDVLQPGDHAQQGGFAAAGRADQHDEFAVVDVDVDAVHDLRRCRRTCGRRGSRPTPSGPPPGRTDCGSPRLRAPAVRYCMNSICNRRVEIKCNDAPDGPVRSRANALRFGTCCAGRMIGASGTRSGIQGNGEMTMAAEKADVLVIGPPKTLIIDGLAKTVHRASCCRGRRIATR